MSTQKCVWAFLAIALKKIFKSENFHLSLIKCNLSFQKKNKDYHIYIYKLNLLNAYKISTKIKNWLDKNFQLYF